VEPDHGGPALDPYPSASTAIALVDSIGARALVSRPDCRRIAGPQIIATQ